VSRLPQAGSKSNRDADFLTLNTHPPPSVLIWLPNWWLAGERQWKVRASAPRGLLVSWATGGWWLVFWLSCDTSELGLASRGTPGHAVEANCVWPWGFETVLAVKPSRVSVGRICASGRPAVCLHVFGLLWLCFPFLYLMSPVNVFISQSDWTVLNTVCIGCLLSRQMQSCVCFKLLCWPAVNVSVTFTYALLLFLCCIYSVILIFILVI
jgi:hypothetical protein